MKSLGLPGGPHGVVVGVDGSPESLAALDWAAHDANIRDVPLTIVHVLAPIDTATWIDVPIPEDFVEMRDRRGEEIMRDAVDSVTEAARETLRVPVRQHMLEGRTVRTLADMSKDADLVVIGCRGVGKIEGLILGSVSTGLLHHAHGPVAVIHAEAAPTSTPTDAPVVVGVDGSPASELAIAVAFDEASRRRVGLVAVHAWLDRVGTIPGLDWRNLRIEAEEILAERLAGWSERYPDVAVERVVVECGPTQQLIDQSASAQLLVVGSHGRGGFAGLLLGSVGSAVAHGARSAVIVVRPR
ncbi:universal stress protein [Mycolicibacterium lacusdiani]|uniref:universal stress protein n=1 Tax=Mycolicibacterium lacusdiani TaxID=2895283 RepID=UPI001F459F5F|nr:universal stress protein [Mycolicibacterium lacusdiani]